MIMRGGDHLIILRIVLLVTIHLIIHHTEAGVGVDTGEGLALLDTLPIGMETITEIGLHPRIGMEAVEIGVGHFLLITLREEEGLHRQNIEVVGDIGLLHDH